MSTKNSNQFVFLWHLKNTVRRYYELRDFVLFPFSSLSAVARFRNGLDMLFRISMNFRLINCIRTVVNKQKFHKQMPFTKDINACLGQVILQTLWKMTLLRGLHFLYFANLVD